MKADELRAWVDHHLNELPRDGEHDLNAEDALERVYGFEPEVFEEVASAIIELIDEESTIDDVMGLLLLFFELGHAWALKKSQDMKDAFPAEAA
jgi:hypothetical protein